MDGVLSFCEMAQPLVARLAEQLGLPGNTPEVRQEPGNSTSLFRIALSAAFHGEARIWRLTTLSNSMHQQMTMTHHH